jgi:uncharacterized protein YggT (Ycf19 family)
MPRQSSQQYLAGNDKTMGWAATSLKLITEIALMAMLGRAVLGFLAGAGRQANVFWQVLDMLCQPFLRATRRLVGPRRLTHGRALAAATFLGLLALWGSATALKVWWWCQAAPGRCG